MTLRVSTYWIRQIKLKGKLKFFIQYKIGILQRNIAKRQKKTSQKKVSNVNDWKNYCYQTKLDFIDNQSIIDHLRAQKFNLKNKRGITIFASNLLKYLRSCFWSLPYSITYKNQLIKPSLQNKCWVAALLMKLMQLTFTICEGINSITFFLAI